MQETTTSHHNNVDNAYRQSQYTASRTDKYDSTHINARQPQTPTGKRHRTTARTSNTQQHKDPKRNIRTLCFCSTVADFSHQLSRHSRGGSGVRGFDRGGADHRFRGDPVCAILEPLNLSRKWVHHHTTTQNGNDATLHGNTERHTSTHDTTQHKRSTITHNNTQQRKREHWDGRTNERE